MAGLGLTSLGVAMTEIHAGGTDRLSNCFWSTCPFGLDKLGAAMKWILVVLVGGVTPVQTDLKFDKLSDCLNAEE